MRNFFVFLVHVHEEGETYVPLRIVISIDFEGWDFLWDIGSSKIRNFHTLHRAESALRLLSEALTLPHRVQPPPLAS
jgi:hypothetical protein